MPSTADDHGLYWQVRCRDDDGEPWKIDVWTLPVDHPGPCAAWIVEPMRRALTNDLRVAILRLKEARTNGQVPDIASIDLYRAVLDDGVRTARRPARMGGQRLRTDLDPLASRVIFRFRRGRGDRWRVGYCVRPARRSSRGPSRSCAPQVRGETQG